NLSVAQRKSRVEEPPRVSERGRKGRLVDHVPRFGTDQVIKHSETASQHRLPVSFRAKLIGNAESRREITVGGLEGCGSRRRNLQIRKIGKTVSGNRRHPRI